MGDVLAELGKKVADLWLTTLLLPGLLLVAAVVCGGLLGQGDALDHARLAAEVQRRGPRGRAGAPAPGPGVLGPPLPGAGRRVGAPGPGGGVDQTDDAQGAHRPAPAV